MHARSTHHTLTGQNFDGTEQLFERLMWKDEICLAIKTQIDLE
jgi:hypothetical protein